MGADFQILGQDAPGFDDDRPAHRDCSCRVGARDRFVTYASVAFQSHIKSSDIPQAGWLTVAPAPYAQATDSARARMQEEECSST